MSCKTILLGIDIDGQAAPLIKLAADLARRFEATLIGCCAADIILPIVTVEGMAIDGELLEQQRVQIESRLAALGQMFTSMAGSGLETEWRSGVLSPTLFLIETARTADLIVTGSPEGARAGDPRRSINLGDFLLHAGRPVLAPASGADQCAARRALVAWKDGREARRAVADAIPFLKRADEVVVATVAREADRWEAESLADVAAYLARHGIRARTELITGTDDARRLSDFAKAMRADLVVSGAYGHSRLREWVFGGVTRSLLNETSLNRLMES